MNVPLEIGGVFSKWLPGLWTLVSPKHAQHGITYTLRMAGSAHEAWECCRIPCLGSTHLLFFVHLQLIRKGLATSRWRVNLMQKQTSKQTESIKETSRIKAHQTLGNCGSVTLMYWSGISGYLEFFGDPCCGMWNLESRYRGEGESGSCPLFAKTTVSTVRS